MNDMHGRWHWKCCALPVISLVFWLAAVLFTIFSWMSVVQNKLILNYGAQWWIVNALIFGLLALYGRGKHCHHGGMGMGGRCEACMTGKGEHTHHEHGGM